VDQLGLLTEQATEKKPGATSVSTGGQ
jgi:hypothetical protein